MGDANNNSYVVDASGNPDAMSTAKIIDGIKNAPACRFDKNKIENDSQAYANFVNRRNDDLQKCSKYLNADNNLVLYPEFKWDVPHKRPPVCYSHGHYNPRADQTALIGTLLNEAYETQVGSIMPTFTHKENVKYCKNNKGCSIE